MDHLMLLIVGCWREVSSPRLIVLLEDGTENNALISCDLSRKRKFIFCFTSSEIVQQSFCPSVPRSFLVWILYKLFCPFKETMGTFGRFLLSFKRRARDRFCGGVTRCILSIFGNNVLSSIYFFPCKHIMIYDNALCPENLVRE